MDENIIEFKNIVKSFGHFIANDRICFSIQRGHIHGIVGENGAGKSTAMKMLFGLYKPDSGSILLKNQKIDFNSPTDAMKCKIGMVHQHFMLADSLTALENLVLFSERKGIFKKLDLKKKQNQFQSVAEKFGFTIPWNEKIENIPVGTQQKIEILKILAQDSEIIILDEPTAVLTPQESNELFANLKMLKSLGKTIIIITHKLKEVLEITDQITVFRAGKVVKNFKTTDSSSELLAEAMVGYRLPTLQRPESININKVLSLENISIHDSDKNKKSLLTESLRDINLHVHSGEIVGIAGVEGNGQNTLIDLISNPKKYFTNKSIISSGKIVLFEKDINFYNSKDIHQESIGFFPEDRYKFGMLKNRPAWENFLLGHQNDPIFQRHGILNISTLKNETDKAFQQFDVRPKDFTLTMGQYSGGNQQKIVVARELLKNPKFILAAQPTRGVDIGAVHFIHEQLLHAKKNGSGVLLISSELDELLSLSDRIYVLFKGKIALMIQRNEFNEIQIGSAMGGLS